MPIKRNNIFKSAPFLKKRGQVLELTDAEIKAYKKGGYIVEEFEDGGTQEPPTRHTLTRNLTFVPNESTQSSFTRTTTPMPKPKYRDPKVVAKQKELIAAGYDIGPTGADGDWGKKSQTAWDEMNTPVKEKSVEKPIKQEQVPIAPVEQRPTGLTKQVPKTQWKQLPNGTYYQDTKAGQSATVGSTGTDIGGRKLKLGGTIGDPPPKKDVLEYKYYRMKNLLDLTLTDDEARKKYINVNPKLYDAYSYFKSKGFTDGKSCTKGQCGFDESSWDNYLKVPEDNDPTDYIERKLERQEQDELTEVDEDEKSDIIPTYTELPVKFDELTEVDEDENITVYDDVNIKTPSINYRPHREWDPATNSFKVMTPQEHRARGRADYKLKTEGPGRIDNTLEGESIDVVTRRKLKRGGVVMELTEKQIADYRKKGLEVVLFK